MTDVEFAKLVGSWTAPAELGGSPPRPVRLSGSGTFLVVVALGMVTGGVILGIKLSNNIATQHDVAKLLGEQGVETRGSIIRLRRGGDKNRSYRVAYQFEAQGRVFHGESGSPRNVWES